MVPQIEAPGAIPILLHAQLTGLAAHHAVTLITIAGPDPQEWTAADNLRELGVEVHAIRRTEPQGLARWQRRWRFASSWLRGRYPFRTIWFWESRVQETIDHLLAQNDYDIVIAEDNATGVYRFQTPAPKVLTEHEVRRPRPIDWRGLAKEKSIRAGLREADWQRWRQYHLSVWQRFDGVQVFTPRDAAAIKNLAPHLASLVRVNPFGIDLPNESDPSQEESGNLVFMGNMTHPPNVDAALWFGTVIMPLLRKQIPNVRLTIVGSYPPPSVRAIAGDDILVAGYVPEIKPFFERAAVVVAPIRTGGGQRMKVLQALAYGKAVVTTARGADGLDIEGCVPPLAIANDAESFATATANLLMSANARRELGRRARAFVEQHYTPAAYARRFEMIAMDLSRNFRR
jgi:glycosyltransferase involved in cell wall biosynthesis